MMKLENCGPCGWTKNQQNIVVNFYLDFVTHRDLLLREPLLKGKAQNS